MEGVESGVHGQEIIKMDQFRLQNLQDQGFNFLDVRKIDGFPPEANTSLLASKFQAIPVPFLRYLAALAAKFKQAGPLFAIFGRASGQILVNMRVLAPLGLVTLVGLLAGGFFKP